VFDLAIYTLAAVTATSVAYVINKQQLESPTQGILRTAALAGLLVGGISSFADLICGITGDLISQFAKLPASIVACFLTTYWVASNNLDTSKELAVGLRKTHN
jgi:hypothetical protein